MSCSDTACPHFLKPSAICERCGLFYTSPAPVNIVLPIEDVVECKATKRYRTHNNIKSWRKSVLKRDGFKCVKCGSVYSLQVHHVIPYSRLDISAHDFIFNGITLCSTCHALQHPELSDGVRSKFSKFTHNTKVI